ncbi:hypothetical protein ABBQ38_005578 [Trebouxia sp. C0009 RCD-2024]
MAGTTGRHDVGGIADDAPIDVGSGTKKYKLWEVQTHSLVSLLSKQGLLTVDELRRGIEGLPDPASEKMSYYERWAASVAISMERGTIQQRELDTHLGVSTAEPAVKFHQGDFVQVQLENAAIRTRKPHLRTPGYIFGLVGTVERKCVGMADNPEGLAFRQDLPRQPLYRVTFHQQHVWEGYTGSPADTVDVEIYQAWLKPATKAQLEQQQHGAHHAHQHKHEEGHHGIGHQHGDPQAINHGDHVHEGRTLVEQTAIDLEGQDDAERRQLSEALIQIFQEKNIISAEELRQVVEDLDGRGEKRLGPMIVAKAWMDPTFKAELLRDAADAVQKLGIQPSNFAPKPKPSDAEDDQQKPVPNLSGTIFTAVENTDSIHNLIVCTLCSCYPLAILGMSPAWYKSRSYRARAVRDPRGVLKEFGTELRPNVAVRVHDSTADMRYMVLPQRPSGTDGWTEEQLQQLVTRDSMIGVTVVKPPSSMCKG